MRLTEDMSDSDDAACCSTASFWRGREIVAGGDRCFRAIVFVVNIYSMSILFKFNNNIRTIIILYFIGMEC